MGTRKDFPFQKAAFLNRFCSEMRRYNQIYHKDMTTPLVLLTAKEDTSTRK